jgi:hypothetical protein
MTVSATVVQEVPRGNFEIVVRIVSDADQKAIMMATPNVYFTTNDKEYVQEANPVHLVPGHLKLSLTNPLKVTLTKGTTLTLVV